MADAAAGGAGDRAALAAAARRVLADARLRERFAASYSGSSDPADALHWTAALGETGPTGAVDPAVAVARLRARLYRVDVSDGDRRHHARAAARVRDDAAAVEALSLIHI